jgi:dipeptidyl aminopeptidase/acylaminoacyl peptidase
MSIAMIILAFAATVPLTAEDALPLVLVQEDVDGGSISPDGKTALVIRFSESKKLYELSLLDLSTKNKTILLSAPHIVAPRMNPDGSRIIFMGSVNSAGLTQDGLKIMNSDGSSIEAFPALRPSDAEDGYAFWSPDGENIAFSRNGQIWMAQADGSNARLVAKGGPDSFAAVSDWMGSTLLISRSDYSGDMDTRYLMDQKTGKLTKLGLQTYYDSIFIDSTETLLYGNGPLRIWNVEDDEEDPEYLPIKPSFSGAVWLSRSADSTKVLLEAMDDMDTTIHHLYLIDTD